MSSEEFAKVCFALQPVLIVAAVAVSAVVVIRVWQPKERSNAGQA